MKILSILLPFSLSFVLLVGSAQSQNIPTKKLTQYLHHLHQQKGFSGEVLIANENEVLFHETIGYLSREYDLEMEKGAKFRIASISKTFTAALISMAEKEGKLKREDYAGKYLSNLSPQFADITMNHLLNHTSGLPHNEGIKDYWQKKSRQTFDTPQMIAEINQTELLFEPGEKVHYSSLGYYLLAAILEEVYKMPFQDLRQEKLLTPLKMTETGSVHTLAIIPQMTQGYHWVNDDSLVVAPYRNYSLAKGSGDLYASTHDLLIWSRAIIDHTVPIDLETEVEEESDHSYQSGWYVQKEAPQKIYHGGGTWGFSSYLSIYPEEKISVIILANVSSLPMTPIADMFEKIVLGEEIEIPKASIEIASGELELSKYAGQYTSDSGKMTLRIIQNEAQLFAKLGPNPPFQIYPKGNDQFFGKKLEIEFTFERNEGQISGISAERMGQTFHFNKQAN